MKQGSTFVLIVNLNVDLSRIDSVIFTLKNKDVTLTKENWTYNNGKFDLPFTQEETVQLQGRTRIEAQINFADGNVAKTQIKDIYIKETLATRIIDDNVATQEGREVELVVEEDVIFTSEDYSKLANKPKINGVVLLGDVSLDTLNIASKEYVEEEIAKFDFIKIVSELPEVGLPNRIYFVPKSNTSDNDLFDEYAWINDDWEFYGTKQIEVDLDDYVKKTDYAGINIAGSIKIFGDDFGFVTNASGYGMIAPATNSDIDGKAKDRKPITPKLLDYAVMKALTDSKNHDWTEEEKVAVAELLGFQEPTPNTLVRRYSSGNIQVPEVPTADVHATSKKYVDDNFVSKFDGSQEDGDLRFTVYGQSMGVETQRPVSRNPKEGALVQYESGGNINVAEPRLEGHASTKKYVDEGFVAIQNPEFDGGATRGYVYFIDSTGKQDIKAVQIQSGANTIPVRNPNGNFYVSTPTLQYECTNKGYVDGLIAQLQAQIDALKG